MDNSKTFIDASDQKFLEIKYSLVDSQHRNQPEDEIKRRDTVYLYFTILTAMLAIISTGCTMVWAGPAILKMKSVDININPLGAPITSFEISKLMAVGGMFPIVLSLFLPKLADLLGRKKSILVMAILMFIGILGLAFSKDINSMCVFSIFTSTALNGQIILVPLYITEICEDHNRGKFCCIVAAFLPMGQVYVYILASIFNFKMFTILTAAPLIIFFILSSFTPESPVYSLYTGKEKECLQAIKKLRGNKTENELMQDVLTIKINLENAEKSRGLNLRKLFGTKEGRVGTLVALIPSTVLYTSGYPVIVAMLSLICNEFNSNISENTMTISVGVAQILLSIFASMIVEKFGRRPLCLISVIGAGIHVSFLGVFFYLKHIESHIIHEYSWITFACILLYISFESIGLAPIPLAIVNEVFPADTKTTGCAIVMTSGMLLVAILISGYPIMADLIGIHWCMWIFGIFSFSGATVIYFVMPETRGKSVVEIQKLLKNY